MLSRALCEVQDSQVSNGKDCSFFDLTIPRGRQVTSVGVLYDFTGNDKNTTVQKVEDMVKEQWFADAIKDEPDFFLLVG